LIAGIVLLSGRWLSAFTGLSGKEVCAVTGNGSGSQKLATSQLIGLGKPGTPSTPQPSESSKPRMLSALPGVTVQNIARMGLLGVALDTIKTFDQVLVGNEVMLFGYPVFLALQPLQQLDPTRPLLRKGIVAGINPEKKSIILDCPVYFGNSGGPALENDTNGFVVNFKIIGVVNQHVPFIQTGGSQTFAMQFASNSGYSIVTPMDFVLELPH